MADKRRAGDWQHKELRKNANDLVEGFDPDPRKWYRQTFWIIFMLVAIWPVGLVLCWRSDWHVGFKILATVLDLVLVYMGITMWQATIALQAAA